MYLSCLLLLAGNVGVGGFRLLNRIVSLEDAFIPNKAFCTRRGGTWRVLTRSRSKAHFPSQNGMNFI